MLYVCVCVYIATSKYMYVITAYNI
jgi:hypothetical protein